MPITSVRLEIDLESGNAAVVEDPGGELRRALKRVVEVLLPLADLVGDEDLANTIVINDTNGTRMGDATLVIDTEPDEFEP